MPKPPPKPKPKAPASPPVIILSPGDRARLVGIANDLIDGLSHFAERFKMRQENMLRDWKPRSALTTHAELTGAQIDAANAREWEAEAKGAMLASQVLKELVGVRPALDGLVEGEGGASRMDDVTLLDGIVVDGDVR